MESLLGDLLPLAVGIAFSPASTIAVMAVGLLVIGSKLLGDDQGVP